MPTANDGLIAFYAMWMHSAMYAIVFCVSVHLQSCQHLTKTRNSSVTERTAQRTMSVEIIVNGALKQCQKRRCY